MPAMRPKQAAMTRRPFTLVSKCGERRPRDREIAAAKRRNQITKIPGIFSSFL